MPSTLKKFGILFIMIFLILALFSMPSWIIELLPLPYGINILDIVFFIIVGIILYVFFEWN